MDNDKTFRCKHFSQMTKDERIKLLNRKDYLIRRGTQFSEHALEAIEKRKVKPIEVIKAIEHGQIIDYRENSKDKRITIRGTFKNRRNLIVYASLSLKDNIIVTTYYDSYYNIHKERDFSKYDKDLKI